MKTLLALAALWAGAALAAPQDVTVTFNAPTTGGAPSGYRLYKDSVLVGPVVSGQKFVALLNDDGVVHVLGVEAWNAGCGASPLPACTRVNKNVTITPIVVPPGPILNITITASCASATPPTCTVVVN